MLPSMRDLLPLEPCPTIRVPHPQTSRRTTELSPALASCGYHISDHHLKIRPKYDMASYPSHKPQTPQPPPPIPINDGDDDQGGATRDY
ncbi:hypothetical protein CGCF413_v007286 [Colletotrichum fructicola]|nr:hypothetical protein CGCF413_v007286 [Colletotrichum fructicola]